MLVIISWWGLTLLFLFGCHWQSADSQEEALDIVMTYVL